MAPEIKIKTNTFTSYDSYKSFDIGESKIKNLPIKIDTFSEDYNQKKWGFYKGSDRNHIYYIKEGRGTVKWQGNNSLNFSSGSFLFFRSDVPIVFAPIGKPYNVKYFTFSGEAATSLLNYYNMPPCAVIKSDPLIKQSFDKILTSINNHLDLEHLSAKLYSFIVDLGATYNSSNQISNFEKAVSYIENHYYHNISVRDISENTNISESTIYKLFKKHLNTSPANYITSIRLNWAKSYLLSESKLSCEQIGTLVGFNSPSYFIECFKNVNGITPNQFRKQNLKEDKETV